MPPAARKSDDKTTTSKAAGADTPDGAYTDAAAKLAAAAREAAEKIREAMQALRDQFDEVQQNAPVGDEATVADGVRRIPMAVGEVERTAEGLLAAAGELAQRAAH